MVRLHRLVVARRVASASTSLINWQLSRDQAEHLRDWLEYLEDIVDEGDDDESMLTICRAELEGLLHQDTLAHPAEIQPKLPD